MSLRFLKAKPKLNLSKDKKVRSAPRNEASKADSQYQSSSDKKIEENEKVQETETKLKVVSDTNTKVCIKEVESSTENEQLSEHKQNEKSVCIENTHVNLKNVANSNGSVGSTISKESASYEKTVKEELIDNAVLQDINLEKRSFNSTNEKKTSVLKSPISPIKNVPAKEIPVTSNTIVVKENKFKTPIGDTFRYKVSSVPINKQSSSTSVTNRNFTNIERKTSPFKSESVLDKEPPAKAKSLSSYIKQLEHEKKQQLPSQENKEKNLSKPIEKEKAPSPKKKNYEGCTTKPAVPFVINIGNSIELQCENQRKTSTLRENAIELTYKTETPFGSRENLIELTCKTKNNNSLGPTENSTELIKCKSESVPFAQTENYTELTCKTEENTPFVTTENYIELKCKTESIPLATRENYTELTPLVVVPKQEYGFSPCKEEKPSSFDLIENKQIVKKEPGQRNKVIEARIQKISNLIEENMNILRQSQPVLNSNKKTKLDKSDMNKNDGKRDFNESDQGRNMILTEDNLRLMPVIMSNNSDASITENKEILPLDHMYAKPTCVNISMSEEMRISHSNQSSITRPEKSLASVKIKNSTHEEKKNRNKLDSSKLNGLNAFQRALVLEEDNKSEDDQMSEASECEPTPFVDVNACTFNDQEEEKEVENTALNQISYSFHDEEFQEFSGLCLVTKFIKQENGDSLCPEMKTELTSPTIDTEYDNNSNTDSNSNSNYFEEKVVYSENIVYIDESTCDDNVMLNELPQDDDALQYSNEETQRKYNFNSTSRQQRNVTFNFSENIKHENKDTKVKIEKKTRKRKIKKETIAADLGVAVDVSDDESKNRKENEIQVDIEVPKRRVKIKKDEDYEYLPVDEPCDSCSDVEIDIDERNFVINGKKMKGMKKKPSESIFLKRQHETLKKIKSQASWKDNLTVSDLIFYNPESNPMTNPPDISIVKTNNETILGKTEPSETKEQSEDEEAVDNPEPVPQLKIGPDGKLIVDPKSLIIEETGLKKSKERLLHSEALVESKYTIKKFDNLYSKKQIKRATNDWSPEDTIMFYRALNTIGTDFSMMATLFENKTRTCIKRKFKLEERKNSTLLSKALRNFNSFDIDELKSELNADRLRVERIKKEEKERLEMIKKEKKERKQAKPKVRKASLCGKLIQDSIEKNPIPPYVKPHFELYTVVNESNNLENNTNMTKQVIML